MKGEKRLVLIGIDRYIDPGYKPLSNPVKDLISYKKVLTERYGFEVYQELKDEEATKENIEDILQDLGSQLEPEDAVIIIFGGHGFQRGPQEEGYWITYNSKYGRHRTLVSNATIITAIRNMKAKHVLLISDSCFAGSLLNVYRDGIAPDDLDELDRLSSRWIFTSGGETKVLDGEKDQGSPFAKSVLQFLESNSLPAFKASSLFARVIQDFHHPMYKQKPRAEPYACDQHQGGELIFRLTNDQLQIELNRLKKKFKVSAQPLTGYIPRTLNSIEQEEKKNIFLLQEPGKDHLEDLIAKQSRIIILGAAGSGKSVELSELAIKMEDPASPYVPVYKRFNTYTDKDIEKFLPPDWEQISPMAMVLFLDGLDEIPPGHFQVALRKINDFADTHPEIRIIISCRTNFYEPPYESMPGVLTEFKVYQLNDLTIKEITEYIRSIGLNEKAFTAGILEHSLLDLVQKPFFLQILTTHFKERNGFSASRTEIINDAILNQFSANHRYYKSTIPLTQDDILRLLEKAAFMMERIGKNFLTDEEMALVFIEEDDRAKLDYLPSFTHNTAERKWMFDHNNIQEFLAARALSSQAADKMLPIITIPSANRIKPTWANTLSFLISLGKDKPAIGEVLNWLVVNEPERVLKFEQERVPEADRITVAKQIIDNYNGKQIWISSSNKFNLKDLGRFASHPEIISYVLCIINNKDSSQLACINMIVTLQFMDLSKAPEFNVLARKALLDALNRSDADEQIVYAVLTAIGELSLGDTPTVHILVERYRMYANEYIRAGLYRLLIEANKVDEYWDVFLAGMDIGNLKGTFGQRSTTHLMDESHFLNEGLQQMTTADGIKQFLFLYENRLYERFLFAEEGSNILKSMVNHILQKHTNDSVIADALLAVYKTTGLTLDDKMTKVILPFFTTTGQQRKAILSIMADSELAEFEKGNLLAGLISKTTIQEIAAVENKYGWTNEQITAFYDVIIRKESTIVDGDTLLKSFRKAILNNRNLELKEPVATTYEHLYYSWAQESFDLLFTPDQFAEIVEKVLTRLIAAGGINTEQMYELRKKNNNPENHIPYAVMHWLSEQLTFGVYLSDAAIISRLQLPSMTSYRILEMYNYMTGSRGYQVALTETQSAYIRTWCEQFLDNENIEALILQENEMVKVLWFFIQRYQITQFPSKLLSFTLYYDSARQANVDDRGSIDILASHVPADRVQEKVLLNLKDKTISYRSWINNAAYAIRHKILEAEASIENFMQTATDDEYKLNALIELWYPHMGSASLLKNIARGNARMTLRKTAIGQLIGIVSEHEFLIELLTSIMQDTTAGTNRQLYAAQTLMYLDQLSGLTFATAYLLNNRDPEGSYGSWLMYANRLTDNAALPMLMQLLYESKHPVYNKRLNFFESEVLQAILAIGSYSRENFNTAKTCFEQFAEKYTSTVPNLGVLNAYLQQMEDNLLIQEATADPIEQAISEYEQIKGSIFTNFIRPYTR